MSLLFAEFLRVISPGGFFLIMARSEKNDVDYFPFYCKEGKTMFYIEQKYNNDGFAVWVKVLRALATTNYHFLNLSNEPDLMFLASKCRVSEAILIDVLTDLCKFNEIDSELWNDHRVVWSEKFNNSISGVYDKRSNKLLEKEEIMQLVLNIRDVNPEKVAEIQQSKVKYSKEEKSKVKHSKELADHEIILPFSSKEFVDVWNVLIKEKKWKNKSFAALQASAEKLSNVSEQDAIQMMKNSIAGGWQGIFELKNNNNNGKGQSNYHSNKTDVAQLVEATKSMLGTNNSNNNGRGD